MLVNRFLLKVDPLFREEMTPDEPEDLLRVVASRQVPVHVRVRHDRLEGVGQKKLAELKNNSKSLKGKITRFVNSISFIVKIHRL